MIDEILDAVVARIEAMEIEISTGVPMPVAKAKHPVQEDGTEVAEEQITVHADPRPRRIRRFNNQSDLHTYTVHATHWKPGNRDNESNLTTLSDLEESIGQEFRQKPADLLDLEDLRDVRGSPGVFLDSGGFGKGWDVSVVDIEIDIVRDRVPL